MPKNFNTTYIRDHLQKKYPTEYSDYEAKVKVRELKGEETTRKATDQLTLAEMQERIKLQDKNDRICEKIPFPHI